MKKLFFIFAILFLFANAAIAQPLRDAKAPEFELSDQNEHVYTLRSFTGRIAVLLANDKDGMEQGREWGTSLQKRYGNSLAVIRIADLRAVPFFMKGKIRNDFKKDKKAILLDWDGHVFNSYCFQKGVANVVLIDKKGLVRFQHSGPPEPEAIDRLCREIDSAE